MKTFITITGIICFILMTSLSQAAETVKIAAIGAKTGDAAPSGYIRFFPVMRFAVDELNQQGGLLGKQVELLELDNKSTPLGSEQAALDAVKAGVIGVIGALYSSHSLPMAPVLQKGHIPMISPSATNPHVTLAGNYIFRACFIDPFQGTVMSDFALKDLGAKRAVVITQAGDPYSMGLAQSFIEHFRKYGGEIILESSYLKGATDFAGILEKTEKLKPDIVFLPGFPRESGYIIRQARKMGISAVFLGGDGWGKQMFEYGGKAIEGSYLSTYWHKESPNEKNREMLIKYSKSPYAGNLDISGSSALSYDAIHLLADAVRRANSFDSSLIRDSLAATKNFQGATGNITFDENRNPLKSAVIVKFDKGNQLVFVKTVEP